MASSKKSAAGCGSIRKKIVKRNGKEYPYWEGRYTCGFDPGTGKQIQKSVTGKTQKEVAQKIKELTAALDAGTYIAPSKMSVGQWLDTWKNEYLTNVKPSTDTSYEATIRNHLKPGLGALRLDALTTHDIQEFYNSLLSATENHKALSPKTIKNIHGVLHHALEQAMLNNYIRANPSNACVIPKAVKKKVKPMNEKQIASFLKAIKGHKYEHMFLVALFTGIREGEVCGLQWDCMDFDNGTILIDKQLQSLRGKTRGNKEKYALISTKSGKERTITAAPYIMEMLRKTKQTQDGFK